MKKHTIVCISGKQGSGKTTLAKALVEKYSGHHFKFADPLYEMHNLISNLLKVTYKFEMKKKDGRLLQLLGTEWGRETLGQNIWADLAVNKIYDTIEKLDKWDKAFIVVDDARFENELDVFLAMKKENWAVLTVRLECPELHRKARADDWRPATNHPSEVGLDGRIDDFDMVMNSEKRSREKILATTVNAIEIAQECDADKLRDAVGIMERLTS